MLVYAAFIYFVDTNECTVLVFVVVVLVVSHCRGKLCVFLLRFFLLSVDAANRRGEWSSASWSLTHSGTWCFIRTLTLNEVRSLFQFTCCSLKSVLSCFVMTFDLSRLCLCYLPNPCVSHCTINCALQPTPPHMNLSRVAKALQNQAETKQSF